VIRREPPARWKKFLLRAILFAAGGHFATRRAWRPTSIPIMIQESVTERAFAPGSCLGVARP
jgi:hypothetical protein